MRLIVPSATIAIITGACRPSFASAVDGSAKEQIANDNSDGFTDAANSQVVHDVDAAYKHSLRWSPERECNTFESKRNGGKGMLSDVGILRCGKGQTCVPDDTSSVGGRCAASSSNERTQQQQQQQRSRVAAFKKRRDRRLIVQSHRQLEDDPDDRQIGSGDRPNVNVGAVNATAADEDEPFVCPPNCPTAFCDCAQADGDAEVCAPELHDVCSGGLLASCVPDKYLPFYEETYCPFATCLAVENKNYEICSCDYYKAYCELYYNFNESVYKCAISTCCEGNGAATKYQCLPALEPTRAPTLSPTTSPSEAPTSSPSVSPSASPSGSPSASPTTSTAPSNSFPPSPSPSASQRPTPFYKPSGFPSWHPSAYPTISMDPSATPTSSPTDDPTAQPTDSPTTPPTGVPTASPEAEEPAVGFVGEVATSDGTRDGPPGEQQQEEEEEEEAPPMTIAGQDKIATRSSSGGAVGAASGVAVASLVAGFGGALWWSLT